MTKTILVTGTAGFIGYHTAIALMKAGYQVIGIDSLTDYYDINLKHDRLKSLESLKGNSQSTFLKGDLANSSFINEIFSQYRPETVVNLAAQAGVRYSLVNPQCYIDSNINGFVNILEGCRHFKTKHLIYASSSSVYGINRKLPFSEEASVDHPISLYAATKKSNELMAHTYSHLFGLPTTGLRFFTVYGPWGRPDMAMFLFATAILEGRPLKLFNAGNMQRDFTYVADVVSSIQRLCEKPAEANPNWSPVSPSPSSSSAPWRIFNIGNHSPVIVKDLVALMERLLDKKAIIETAPIQPGDVEATFADVDKLRDWVDFQPSTSLEFGVDAFLKWLLPYREERLKRGDGTFGKIKL